MLTLFERGFIAGCVNFHERRCSVDNVILLWTQILPEHAYFSKSFDTLLGDHQARASPTHGGPSPSCYRLHLA